MIYYTDVEMVFKKPLIYVLLERRIRWDEFQSRRRRYECGCMPHRYTALRISRYIKKTNKYTTKLTARRHDDNNVTVYGVFAIAFGGCGTQNFIVASTHTRIYTYKCVCAAGENLRLHCRRRRNDNNILLYYYYYYYTLFSTTTVCLLHCL